MACNWHMNSSLWPYRFYKLSDWKWREYEFYSDLLVSGIISHILIIKSLRLLAINKNTIANKAVDVLKEYIKRKYIKRKKIE